MTTCGDYGIDTLEEAAKRPLDRRPLRGHQEAGAAAPSPVQSRCIAVAYPILSRCRAVAEPLKILEAAVPAEGGGGGGGGDFGGYSLERRSRESSEKCKLLGRLL